MRSVEAGNIKGALWASFVIALLIVLLPVLIAMTYPEYPRYCKMLILLPCVSFEVPWI